MVVIVRQSLPPRSRLHGFLAIMMAATVLSGPQLYILSSASIYHEPILWSATMATTFNLVLVRTAFGGGALGARDLVWLAILAGLAINTRASIGVALYQGATLLVAWAARKRHAGGTSTTIRGLASDPSIVVRFAVLMLFAIAVGAINFARWGNPFIFIDFRYYYWGLRHANFLDILQNYGEINLGRMWIGGLYYATGISYLLKGVHPFAEFLDSRFAAIEAPPFSPFLTNPITIFLAGTGIYHLCWRPSLPPPKHSDPSARTGRPLFRGAPDLGRDVPDDALPLRFRALHDHGGAHRLSSYFVRGGGKTRELAQAVAHRGIGFVRARDFGQPLRPFGS